MDLESVLTYFKQVTHSYWGTRQSPSQSKASTRLMWKSQYVPFDGIPFINASKFSSFTVVTFDTVNHIQSMFGMSSKDVTEYCFSAYTWKSN